VWEDGNLVALALGPDRSSTFGYGITLLPEAVRDLEALRYLDLHANELAQVPAELCELTALRHLYLFRNQLASLPESLGDLASLEVLMIGDNRIEQLPESIEDLASLERLQLSGNPLAALPDGLRELRRLEVLDIARTGSAENAGFENLALVLDSLGALEEIQLTGPEVGDAEPPERLQDGSIERVYGYTRGGSR
jgi:Leucine-rich repeat (LRR) protein